MYTLNTSNYWITRQDKKAIRGKIVVIDDEFFYKIKNYDLMPPFLISLVSNTDLWMFISSNGSLTAGRKNPDNSLFPYSTDDKIHDSLDVTGNKTIILIKKEEEIYLWEPFSLRYKGFYATENNIYKNILSNKIIFEEVNLDLSITFRYSWQNCDKFGFIKKSKIINNSHTNIYVKILDGILNILPSGSSYKFQLEYSTLLDGYKKNELIENTTIALFTLSSIPTDKAEPNEALSATVVWSFGLDNPKILLTPKQLELFRAGLPINQEVISKGERGAYLLQSEFELQAERFKEWYIVADINKDHSDIAEIVSFFKYTDDLKKKIDYEVKKDNEKLLLKCAKADALQLTNDNLIQFRHYSDVLFNIMRGGVFEANYQIEKSDFVKFVKTSNKKLFNEHAELLEKLPSQINKAELLNEIEKVSDPCLLKLFYEYLPLTFSRRHGDPSRPWNYFSINLKDEYGNKVFNYEGNWRDIFQNWEALAYSYPYYLENMIVKFLNAMTADGYNPYRITKNSFEWEELKPDDVWSYIGYWGDHQIIYLLKLIELLNKFYPESLESLLTKEIFTYANIPYKIKPYELLVKDPRNTIDFDFELNSKIKEKVNKTGTDNKLIYNSNGELYFVNLIEKILVIILTKLSNFVPEAGIWMNTQRPEWNDANNALVGYGTSMVTLYYMRRFLTFCLGLLKKSNKDYFEISNEVHDFYVCISGALSDFQYLLRDNFSDKNRKRLLDRLGTAGSYYRNKIYSNSFPSGKTKISLVELILFLMNVLEYLDHSIKANKRKDGLYNSYNLIDIYEDKVCINNLYEMLEGQVAVLSSGYLSLNESVELIEALRYSKLYREDQNSYMLYPERELPHFMNKNIIPKELYEKSELLKLMIDKGDKRIVIKDIDGYVHFNSKFRNASVLEEELSELDDYDVHMIEKERESIKNIYEAVFNHRFFTGRSCTFYKYEGIGCIYWHMVSKLMLAVQEVFFNAINIKADDSIITKLKNAYYKIRNGLGFQKTPEQYGAFPQDAYSHTPKDLGAQQPGLTGQVKENIIARLGELGIIINDGQIEFKPTLLNCSEFITKKQIFKYYDVNNNSQSLVLDAGMLAFTFCQVPVVYSVSNEDKIVIAKSDGTEEVFNGTIITKELSKSIFQREGMITKIIVLINKTKK